jgi:hypothetical protein
VRTRSLAVKLIEARKVRKYQRALKVCRHVRLGDVVTGTEAAAGHLFVVRFAGEALRRSPLYEDLTPEVAALAVELARIEVHRGLRPTKRDRRRLDAIKVDVFEALQGRAPAPPRAFCDGNRLPCTGRAIGIGKAPHRRRVSGAW